MSEDLRLTAINELEIIWAQKNDDLKLEEYISDFCLKTIKEHSEPAFFLKDLGDHFLDNKNYFLAEFLYKRALSENSFYLPAIINLGKLRFNTHNYAEAIEYGKQAICNSKDILIVLDLLGNAYLCLSEFDNATKIYSTLLLLDDNSNEAHIGLARIDYYQGNYHSVIEKFLTLEHSVLSEGKTNSLLKYYYYYAHSHQKLKNWNEAVNLFLKFLEFEEDQKRTLLEIVGLYSVLQNYMSASIYCIKLIELELLDGEFNGINYLVPLLPHLIEDSETDYSEYLDAVIETLSNIENTIKDFSGVAEAIVITYNIRGNYEAALNNAQFYIEKHTGSVELLRQMSLSYFFMNNDDGYLKSLKDILALQPSNKDALEKLIEFYSLKNETDLALNYQAKLRKIQD